MSTWSIMTDDERRGKERDGHNSGGVRVSNADQHRWSRGVAVYAETSGKKNTISSLGIPGLVSAVAVNVGSATSATSGKDHVKCAKWGLVTPGPVSGIYRSVSFGNRELFLRPQHRQGPEQS